MKRVTELQERIAGIVSNWESQGMRRPGRGTLQGITGASEWHVRQALADMDITNTDAEPEFQVEPLPNADLPLDELIARKKDEFARGKKLADALQEVTVFVNVDGPIAISHFGDPHIDDPGCDLALLEHHMTIVRDTPGMFAGNVGDSQNNWAPRLCHLFAKQETTKHDARRLVEWLLRGFGLKWLYVIGGNHDAWSGENDPLEWIMSQDRADQGHFRYHGVRIKLRFPNGKDVYISARHDFKGSSISNNAHGPMRAAKKLHDHIFTCGHRHCSGYGIVKSPGGMVSHCIRVPAYKTIDEYAQQGGYDDETISPCVTTIIDPDLPDGHPDQIDTYQGPARAAYVLTQLRNQHSKRKAAA